MRSRGFLSLVRFLVSFFDASLGDGAVGSGDCWKLATVDLVALFAAPTQVRELDFALKKLTYPSLQCSVAVLWCALDLTGSCGCPFEVEIGMASMFVAHVALPSELDSLCLR